MSSYSAYILGHKTPVRRQMVPPGDAPLLFRRKCVMMLSACPCAPDDYDPESRACMACGVLRSAMSEASGSAVVGTSHHMSVVPVGGSGHSVAANPLASTNLTTAGSKADVATREAAIRSIIASVSSMVNNTSKRKRPTMMSFLPDDDDGKGGCNNRRRRAVANRAAFISTMASRKTTLEPTDVIYRRRGRKSVFASTSYSGDVSADTSCTAFDCEKCPHCGTVVGELPRAVDMVDAASDPVNFIKATAEGILSSGSVCALAGGTCVIGKTFCCSQTFKGNVSHEDFSVSFKTALDKFLSSEAGYKFVATPARRKFLLINTLVSFSMAHTIAARCDCIEKTVTDFTGSDGSRIKRYPSFMETVVKMLGGVNMTCAGRAVKVVWMNFLRPEVNTQI